MDLKLAAVAETLAYEFEDLPCSSVVRVLTDCVDEFPHNDQHFIEQAARAQLSLLRWRYVGWQTMPTGDSLDVSLHDRDVADEVDLMTRLIVAANETDAPLAQAEVDTILGVPPRFECPVVPHQRLTGRRESGSLNGVTT